MAIVKMKKLSVIGMQDEREDVLKNLQNLGLVEVSNNQDKLQDEEWQNLVVKDSDDAKAAEKDRELAQVKQALSIIDQFGKLKKPMFAVRKSMTESEFADYCGKKSDLESKMHEIISLYDEYTGAQDQENAANAEIFALTPWQNYNVPLEETSTENLALALGVFPPTADLDAITESIESEGLQISLQEVARDKEQIYARLWYFRCDESKVLEIAKAAGFNKPAFDATEGTIEQNIEKCNSVIAEMASKKETILKQIEEKSIYKEDLEIYHDIVITERDESRTRGKLVTTERTFEFDGYVPASAMNKVKEALKPYVVSYVFSDPEEGDDVPVQLKNKSFFSPAEFITQLYSLPSYNEVDPTSIFTFFYIIFFGIMFGDVGYGVLLIVGSLLAVKKFHMTEGGAGKLMKVIFYSGISSVFWGFMFGSIFGDLIPVIGKTFFDKTITITPLWLDPAKEPMIFLVFSCACGVVHLFVGMGIKAYEQIKEGKFLDACKDVFAWYLIVLGLVMWLFGGKVAAPLTNVGKWMAIAGFALAMILPVFTAKGSGKALGIWDIYSGVTGNLSDILSYSRLLGLGLASTSIAAVFNFLASMGGKSVVGVIMFVLIFLVGHALNFGINALGAFVHSCRLQYVEFFGRFYEGGGREFDPFFRNTKYIKIIEGGN